LIRKNTSRVRYGVFKVRGPATAQTDRTRLAAGLSKLNSVRDVEVDVLPGELEHRTASEEDIDESSSLPE
jgi:hypothetical protein